MQTNLQLLNFFLIIQSVHHGVVRRRFCHVNFSYLHLGRKAIVAIVSADPAERIEHPVTIFYAQTLYVTDYAHKWNTYRD